MRRRRSRIRRLVVAVVVLGALATGGYAIATSSLFGITGIEVVGTSHTTAVIDASGLRVGQNALGLDRAAAAARVEALPFVADARVERAGTLGVRVVVVERRPAIVAHVAGAVLVLDQNGVVMQGDAIPATLPVIALSGGSEPPLDPAALEAVKEALGFWRAVGAEMRSRMGDVFFSQDGMVSFSLDGARILFGRPDAIPAKMGAIASVMLRVAAEHKTVTQINVSAPTRPAARIR